MNCKAKSKRKALKREFESGKFMKTQQLEKSRKEAISLVICKSEKHVKNVSNEHNS